MSSLIDNYNENELQQIVEQSNSFRELARKLGYTAFSGDLKNFLEEKIEKFDYSHFGQKKEPIKRTAENVFIENSTADQKTLRNWFVKGNYVPYVCNICGQEPIWQGKELTLILDHINGSNHDDRLENLRWVCPNCNQQLDTTNGKNRKQQYTKKKFCVDCGKEISLNSIRCLGCANKKRAVSLEDMPITREELKELIRTTPFTTIGTNFNVSDNAIRKWCDKFNLPHTKKEINSYSDKEWADI